MIEHNYRLGKLYNADCLDAMKSMDADSVDCMVTDVPYGISFMNRQWDKAVPSVEIWTECLRVMKPGAFAFIFSLPRQDVLSRMIVNLEDAGFDCSFTSLYHSFSSGFPKASNISKMIDKRATVDCEKCMGTGFVYIDLEGKAIAAPIGETFWQVGKADSIKCSACNGTGSVKGAEREVVGVKKRTGNPINTFANGTENYRPYQKKQLEKYGHYVDIETAPATTEAKQFDGAYSGFSPKPAVEVILCVMKPLSESTYVDQALANGKGVTWLGSGRIPGRDESQDRGAKQTSNTYGEIDVDKLDNAYPKDLGRFPANLLVSDNALDTGEVRKSGGKAGNSYKKTSIAFSENKVDSIYQDRCSDKSGDYSRFFSLESWFAEHLKELPPKVRDKLPFLIVPKPSKGEKNAGCDGLKDRYDVGAYGNGIGNVPKENGERPTPYKNIHPTCKSIALMNYLITIGSRPGDTILDPFLGRGTTALSATMLNRRWVGCEIDAEYCEIIKARLEHLEDTMTPDLFEGVV